MTSLGSPALATTRRSTATPRIYCLRLQGLTATARIYPPALLYMRGVKLELIPPDCPTLSVITYIRPIGLSLVFVFGAFSDRRSACSDWRGIPGVGHGSGRE